MNTKETKMNTKEETPIYEQRMEIIFNEWNRRYSNSSDDFKSSLNENGEPIKNYGKICTEMFKKIADDLDKEGILPTTP